MLLISEFRIEIVFRLLAWFECTPCMAYAYTAVRFSSEAHLRHWTRLRKIEFSYKAVQAHG